MRLADGDEVPYDRLLIATGVRARPWPNEAEAALDGVFVLRTRDDARRGCTGGSTPGPRRVLVIGAGFTGSEIASACRELGLPVTVAERGAAPLVGALGGVIGAVAAEMQREHGVDLRCGVTVTALEGDAAGRLRARPPVRRHHARRRRGGRLRSARSATSSGSPAPGWRPARGASPATRAAAPSTSDGIVTDDIFVAGDVARSPHPLFGYQFLALEHWGNAVAQAEIAAHNMISAGTDRRPHLSVPAFWSTQFGINIKSVGVPPFADESSSRQGSVAERRFVAAYGYQGRVIGAVTFDQAQWLAFYQRLIETAAPFPPPFPTRRPARRRAAAGAGRLPGPRACPPTAPTVHRSTRLLARPTRREVDAFTPVASTDPTAPLRPPERPRTATS